MKKCARCKEIKDYSQYHRNRTIEDGYARTCTPCYNSQNFHKKFSCTECSKEFIVRHRNVKRRKYFLCEKCTNQKSGYSRTKEGNTKLDHGYMRLKSDKKEKSHFVHRKMMENFLKRPLVKGEIVHHIDGNKLNNDLDNLWLTNHSAHTKAHDTLEKIGMQLYRQGLVVFDKKTGEYKLIS